MMQHFSTGIEFMKKQGIIQVPEIQTQKTDDSTIPEWVRNNAKWWSDGQIGDKDFAAGLQYLIKVGMISV